MNPVSLLPLFNYTIKILTLSFRPYNRIYILSSFLAITNTCYGIDPQEYVPYVNSGFFTYTPSVCDRFLSNNSRIEVLVPTLAQDKLNEIGKKCPTIRMDNQYLISFKKGYNTLRAVYKVDIDNDGNDDTILYYSDVFRETTSESLLKIDLDKCSGTKAFYSYNTTRIITLDGTTFIENTNPSCRGPYNGKYLSCKHLYHLTKGKLDPRVFNDQMCMYIEKSWLNLDSSKMKK